MKNKLIVIGHMSDKSCYLNVSKEEAQKRYKKDNDYLDDEDIEGLIEEIEFDDEFEAYDAWGK